MSLIFFLVKSSILVFNFMVLFIINMGKFFSSSLWNLHLALHSFMMLSYIKLNISQFSLASTNSSLLVFVGYSTSPNISPFVNWKIIVLLPLKSYLIKFAVPGKQYAHLISFFYICCNYFTFFEWTFCYFVAIVIKVFKEIWSIKICYHC